MKILYIMHVEWGWIKQRPHFIAEELSKSHHVRVYYQKMYSRFKRSENVSGIKRSAFFTIPKKSNIFLGIVNNVILKIFFYTIIKLGKYNFIYVTHPDQLMYLPELTIPVIYDCMDDHSSFGDLGKDGDLKRNEIELFSKADLVLFSSFYLKEKNEMYVDQKKTELLFNGISERLKEIMRDNKGEKILLIKNIFYIGTIAEWFDFSAIELILERCPSVRFTIIGPADIKLPDLGDRVLYMGPVDHSQLNKIVEDADVFIMPFVLNELIRSVDPVKMYEYISFCRPIISIHYEELDKFSGFVNFYKDRDQLAIICDLINSSSLEGYSREQAGSFISKSTWAKRVERRLGVYIKNKRFYE
ncbi:glycosyltransferase [Deinococcus rubellus]|uniref:Glycosyltransferase n=1 Tax=Deinococcus rubellus TaxID=1889240 RepID=A0ABY5YDK9_9DEIO|nr:glycosyltransferase [Deinococcus rubellus]UWX63152.1 glycosyltransferase [Deinococcus rubellus]